VFEDTHVEWRQFSDMMVQAGFGLPIGVHPMGGGSAVPTYFF
jgi:hypothetical protein